jgi:hypothetical protein
MERFMQQHRKTAEISPLILALALVSLLFTACGNEPTPTTVNIIASTTPASTVGAVQSPLVVTPPVTSLQKGKLKDVFPALANLENDVLAIEVEYDDSHYYTSLSFPNPFTPPWDGNYNGKTFFIEDAKELLFSIQALNSYTESGAILQDLHQQYLKKKNPPTL